MHLTGYFEADELDEACSRNVGWFRFAGWGLGFLGFRVLGFRGLGLGFLGFRVRGQPKGEKQESQPLAA